jgi:hypothetical protein
MRPPHPHRRSLVAVGVPALVVTLGVGGVLVTAPRTDGPLVAPSAVTVEFELAIGRAGTWGIILPTNPTMSDITIESIEAVDARGLQIVGMLINDPERDGGIGSLDVYPPLGVLARAVEGAVLPAVGTDPPHRQLLIGVRRTGTDAGSIEALRVRYRHAGESYEVILPYSLRIRPAGG